MSVGILFGYVSFCNNRHNTSVPGNSNPKVDLNNVYSFHLKWIDANK